MSSITDRLAIVRDMGDLSATQFKLLQTMKNTKCM